MTPGIWFPTPSCPTDPTAAITFALLHPEQAHVVAALIERGGDEAVNSIFDALCDGCPGFDRIDDDHGVNADRVIFTRQHVADALAAYYC